MGGAGAGASCADEATDGRLADEAPAAMDESVVDEAADVSELVDAMAIWSSIGDIGDQGQ